MPSKPALSLPDSLLVRYFRAEEIDFVSEVTTPQPDRVTVRLQLPDRGPRTDTWRDLGGGIGYVPTDD